MPRQYNRKKPFQPREAKLDSSTKTQEEIAVDVNRYVEGRSVSPADPIASPDIMAAFLAALQQMSTDNRDNMIAAIQEMKKPSEEEQEKIDREKRQRIEQTLRRVEAARAQEAEIAERQESCGHVMPNGQTNFRGQVNSNGWAHVFCSHCHKSYEFEATDVEANKSGLNVDKWGTNAHTIIRNRAAASMDLIPPPVPRIPAGATIIFD